jgi:hypothetical protein
MGKEKREEEEKGEGGRCAYDVLLDWYDVLLKWVLSSVVS